MFYEHTGRGYSANKHSTETTTQRNAAPCSTTHGRACCPGHDPQKTAHKRAFGSDAPAIEEHRTWPSLRADGGACVCMCVRIVCNVCATFLVLSMSNIPEFDFSARRGNRQLKPLTHANTQTFQHQWTKVETLLV